MDRSAYERMVSEAQHQFFAQTALLMKSLSRVLPHPRKTAAQRRRNGNHSLGGWVREATSASERFAERIRALASTLAATY